MVQWYLNIFVILLLTNNNNSLIKVLQKNKRNYLSQILNISTLFHIFSFFHTF